MLSYKVELTGRTPFLQDAYAEPGEGTSPIESLPKTKKAIAPREIAEKACHRNEQGYIFHPATSILNLLEEAGKRIKVGRGTLKALVSTSVTMLGEHLDFYNEDGSPLVDFEVHQQYVPNGLGQKVKKVRPRFDLWVATFEIAVRDEVVDPALINQALVEGGQWIGLGAFRLQQKGPFGRFAVTKWEEIKPEGAESTRTVRKAAKELAKT